MDSMQNPLLLPEIAGLVLDNVSVRDLLNCACVNNLWNILALKRLYKGSLHDMQFRTPDITSLNCLYTASRERFARNMGFQNQLANLRALTIYKVDPSGSISDLCSVINMCQLQFFHLKVSDEPEILSYESATILLRRLSTQRGLRALALDVPNILPNFQELAQGEIPWPKLRMLYFGPQSMPEIGAWLPKFSKLQMLSLPLIGPLLTAIRQVPDIKGRLRLLNVVLFEVDDSEALHEIPPGCHRLQKLTLGYPGRGESGLRKEDVIERLAYFPRLESLVVTWAFTLDAGSLRHIASQCPQLTVLAMRLAEIHLSLSLPSLKMIPSFERLEALACGELPFENPSLFTRQDRFLELAAEWRRVFPKLRAIPIPVDDYVAYGDAESDSLLSRLFSFLGCSKDPNVAWKREYLLQPTWKLRPPVGL
ncbi:hypothetical protein BDW62DRAFT_200778 [Aspergillus aurantiobrunneus]